MQNEKDRDKMRILIISDTHGKHDNLQKIFSTEEAFDLMLHLGDAEGGYEDILSLTPCPLHIVAGNMDGLSGLPEEKMLTLDGYRVWMRHGHQEGVSSRLDHLREEAEEREADIVLFGHTHMPYLETGSGITYVNPGSISFPRPLGKVPSYVVMDISNDGRVVFEHKKIL